MQKKVRTVTVILNGNILLKVTCFDKVRVYDKLAIARLCCVEVYYMYKIKNCVSMYKSFIHVLKTYLILINSP